MKETDEEQTRRMLNSALFVKFIVGFALIGAAIISVFLLVSRSSVR